MPRATRRSKKDLMNNLPRLGGIMTAAIEEWATGIGVAVIENYPNNPLTPVLTGALRSAGSVFVNGEYIKRTKKRMTGVPKPRGRKRLYYPPTRKLPSGVKKFQSSVTVDWVVNTPYAQDPRFPHQPYRGVNYLRIPIVIAAFTGMQNAPRIVMKSVKRRIK